MVTEPLPTRVWHLAMDEPGALRPAAARDGVSVGLAEVPLGPLNRWLYGEIGAAHAWLDRGRWDAARWQAHAESVETLLAFVRGTPAGMAELRRQGEDFDIYIFGLLPAFHGQGAGGVLLTEAIRRCWAHRPARVTVNTCELDGPAALPNYHARGFALDRETIEPRRRIGGPVHAIRDARAGEADALEALQRRASLVWDEYRVQLEAADPSIFALPAGGRVRVAVDAEDRPLGFSAVVGEELDGLFVEPELHGRGVGRLLVLDVVARERGRLSVVAGPARGFYERLGFVVTGEATTRFGPAWSMVREP